jgi:tetratricopeptide (TPR) repeat protein
VSKLAAPLAVFGAVLVAMVALNDGATTPPAPAAAHAGRAHAAVGNRYLAQARALGDPDLYGRAERAFTAALREDPSDVAALTGSGALAGLRHDFREQLRLGRAARRSEPGLAQPVTVTADAQIELGDYPAAHRSIQRLLNLKPGLPAYARASYYRELHGDVAGAVDAMRFAISAGGTPDSVAYVEALLGDLELARGRAAAARTAYRTALRDVPAYPQALTGLARLDAATGDLETAVARLRRSTAQRPLSTSLTLLAEAERAAGRARAARRHLSEARGTFAADLAAGGYLDAEAVLFEANHGSSKRAIEIGRDVYGRAPSIRSADALGWALTRGGRPRAGYRWARRALGTGSRDPMFRLHAGLAAARVGIPVEASGHLAMARRGAGFLSPAMRELLPD